MLELSGTERVGLAEALRTTSVRRHWVRLRAVWLAAEGRPVPEIAADLGAGASSVFAWLAQWRTTSDPAALADAPRSGRPRALDDPLRGQLEALLAVPPEVHGHHTTGWTVPLLQHHFTTVLRVPVSGTTLRRTLHAMGYRWKRPRYVLARRDPERAGKKGGPRGAGGRGPSDAEYGGAVLRWCCVRTRPSCASSRRSARAGASAAPRSRCP